MNIKVNNSWTDINRGYAKVNGSWVELGKGYAKINGSWVELKFGSGGGIADRASWSDRVNNFITYRGTDSDKSGIYYQPASSGFGSIYAYGSPIYTGGSETGNNTGRCFIYNITADTYTDTNIRFHGFSTGAFCAHKNSNNTNYVCGVLDRYSFGSSTAFASTIVVHNLSTNATSQLNIPSNLPTTAGYRTRVFGGTLIDDRYLYFMASFMYGKFSVTSDYTDVSGSSYMYMFDTQTQTLTSTTAFQYLNRPTFVYDGKKYFYIFAAGNGSATTTGIIMKIDKSNPTTIVKQVTTGNDYFCYGQNPVSLIYDDVSEYIICKSYNFTSNPSLAAPHMTYWDTDTLEVKTIQTSGYTGQGSDLHDSGSGFCGDIVLASHATDRKQDRIYSTQGQRFLFGFRT